MVGVMDMCTTSGYEYDKWIQVRRVDTSTTSGYEYDEWI